MTQDLDFLVKEWDTHIRNTSYSSRGQDYLECIAFRSLVEQAKSDPEKTLPYMLVRSERGDFEGVYHLPSYLINIFGSDFSLPKELRGKIEASKQYAIDWLRNYLKRKKII